MTLMQYLITHGESALEFGARIGLKQPNYVYKWLDGARTPGPRSMRLIAQATRCKVMPNDFHPDVVALVQGGG